MNMDTISPGDRVGAHINFKPDEDSDYVVTVEYGVYEGMEPCPVLGERQNPKITLDSGTVIWGYQCWWGSEEEIKAVAKRENIPEGLYSGVIEGT